jgi:UDP-2,3-diacylglucosamine hydrolase
LNAPERGGLPEVELAPGTLFIADLHLDATRAEACAGFAAWLDAQRVPRLVLLGDLFDAWVGPAHARLPGAAAVLAALAAASSRGLRLDLVPGNRDFLLGRDFSARTGARLHPHGFVGRLPGPGEGPERRVLCLHGDELCTRDRAYQRLKRVVRSAPVAWLAPRLPDATALWAARRLRRASQQALYTKPAEEKAQQAVAVAALARAHGAATLVCGHAHVHRDARVEGVRWLVLDAFGGGRDALRVEPDGALSVVASGGLAGRGVGTGPASPTFEGKNHGGTEDTGPRG